MIEIAARDAVMAGQTSDPLVSAIFLAENINQRNGGALIKPWEIEEMPGDYKTAYLEILRAVGKKEKENGHSFTCSFNY